MSMSNIFLPFSGGSGSERFLRNRGRLRHAVASHHVGKLRRAFEAFKRGEWKPLCNHRISNYCISLTSWRPRLPDLPLVLLALLQQTLRPKEIVVWLSEADLHNLGTLVQEHFEEFCIRFQTCTSDIGPHNKWLPMIEAGQRDPFVICDDDTIYPSEWFESLVAEDRLDAYVGCKCHRIVMGAEGLIAPYSAWEKQIENDGEPSHWIFVTGAGGAVVHPNRISPGFLDRTEVAQKCPKADDVWLKAAHLAAGIPCYKTRYSFPCLEFPGTDQSGLAMTNVEGGGNDDQIRNLSHYFSMISPKLRGNTS